MIELGFEKCLFQTENTKDVLVREFRRPYESVSSFSVNSNRRARTYFPIETAVESVKSHFTFIHGTKALPIDLDHDSQFFWRDVQKLCSMYSFPHTGCIVLGHQANVSSLIEISSLLSNIPMKKTEICDDGPCLVALADRLLELFEFISSTKSNITKALTVVWCVRISRSISTTTYQASPNFNMKIAFF